MARRSPRMSATVKPFALLVNTKGQNEREGVFTIQPDSAVLIENLHMDRVAEFNNHNRGYEHLTGNLGARVDAVKLFKTTAGDLKLIGSYNGEIHSLNIETGADLATLSSANTAEACLSGTAFQGEYYLCDGTMTPESWNGVAATTTVEDAYPIVVGSDSYNNPEILITWQNRLIAAGFDGFPSHLAMFDTLDGHTITLPATADDDGFVGEVSPGDGQVIKAASTLYLPQLNIDMLVIFKDDSVYGITGTTPIASGDVFTLQKLIDGYGALNKNCVAKVGNDIYFLGKENIYSLTVGLQSGAIEPSPVGSNNIRETLRTINTGAADKAWVSHQPSRQEIWFGIPTGASTEVDKILVYRYFGNPQQGGGVWSIRTGFDATSFALNDSVLYTGATDGYINKWFTASGYAGSGINWVYRFPFWDLGAPYQHKRLQMLRAYFLVQQTETITIGYRWRRSDNFTLAKTTAKTLDGATSGLWDVAFWDVDYYSYDDGTLVYVQMPVYGNGKQCQFEVSGTTGDSGITFLGIAGLVEYGKPDREYF